ncbi:MAG: hypothetical protein C4289_12195 [Chloroflexota bacterium]
MRVVEWLQRFAIGLLNTVVWSAVSLAFVFVVFEALNRRYQLMQEIFEENNAGAGALAGAIILAIAFVVGMVVTH